MIKISNSKIFKYSIQGLGVRIPVVFEEDNKLTSEDQMEIFRTIVDGKDALILIPSKSNGNNTAKSSLKSQNNDEKKL